VLSYFFWINMNQQSHVCFQCNRKLLTIFFFFYQKKAQAQLLAGAAREFLELPCWGILPSFPVYAAFLFMPCTPPRTHGRGEEATTDFKPAYRERWEIESSFVVNTHVLFKNK